MRKTNIKTAVSLTAAASYLNQLDLNYLIETMCSTSYFLPRWRPADAVQCEKSYKNFLFLQKKYSHLNLVPNREIDEFWHNHILHTKNYFNDCQQIFGHYLHHSPAVAGEAPDQLIEAYLLTKQLYLQEF